MRIERKGATRGMLASALALIFGAATAAAGPANDIGWVSFSHQPESPTEGRYVVELDEEGNWSQVVSDFASWRMNYQIAWINHPTHIKYLQFSLRPLGATGDGAFAGHVTYQQPEHFSSSSTARPSCRPRST